MVITALFIILFFILILPFLVPRVERELEIFLFLMGIIAVSVSGSWSVALVQSATSHPLPIAGTVLLAGFAFARGKRYIAKIVEYILARRSGHTFFFLLVLVLSLLSSVITAIIAALILVEVISILKLDRKTETEFTILSCFAIGLGACLTPVGEPLSTIAVGKLAAEPYNAGFFFMVGFLGWPVLIGVMILAVAAGFLHGKKVRTQTLFDIGPREDARRIGLRAIKVYLFVAGLWFLGEGYAVIIDRYVIHLPHYALYFINIISAVLDNATLAAAEISPQLNALQLKSALLSLLVSGGILIPGNIPNIIAANKLGIGSRDWARYGVPVGAALLLFYFVWILLGW